MKARTPLETKRGAYIPDELHFGSKSTFFITLNVGGQPSSFDHRQISVRSATLADLKFASEAINHFCNAVLRDLYGHGWMSRSDINFSILAVPETRGKHGEAVPLHFHIAFDGTGLSDMHADHFKRLVAAAWTKVAQRRFGHVPGFKTLRTRNIKKLALYITKWLEPGSPHEAAMITKSACKGFRERARLRAGNPIAFSQHPAV